VQPRYITLTSTGASAWQVPNWHTSGGQQFGFQVTSTGGSSWFVDVTIEDPTGTFPNPNSSAPTGFTVMTGSSNQFFGIPSSFGNSVAIAGFRFTLNTQSSAGAKVTLASIQSGIG
jgi:hypothetical protein